VIKIDCSGGTQNVEVINGEGCQIDGEIPYCVGNYIADDEYGYNYFVSGSYYNVIRKRNISFIFFRS
jgi:hypothetical protein